MARSAKNPPKPKTSLRKSPTQSRSKILVNSVVEATARILQTTGLDGLNTNKIAELAGISVGSLYQYFPGKDAIFSALIEKLTDDNAQRFHEIVASEKKDDVRAIVSWLVADTVDMFYSKRYLMAGLFSEVPKMKKTRDVLFRRNQMLTIFIDYLRNHLEDLRDPENIDQQVYIAAHAVMGVTHTAVLEDFEHYSPTILKSRLEEMICSFLFKPLP